jgi:hypothetical protein
MPIFQTPLKATLLILKSISVMSLLLFSPLSSAEQWYHVEVIVFEQLNTVTDEQAPVISVPKGSFSPGAANELFQPSKNSSLLDSARKLKRSPFYQVHYHQSWQQVIKTKSQAKSLTINSTNHMVQGRIRLHKGTYLYASLDLQLNRLSPQDSSGAEVGSVRKPYLKEARRVRSKKLHLFDHPNMGALLKLTPIESPQSSTASPG